MCVMISLLKHFVVVDVNDTEQQSSRPATLFYLGTGAMVIFLKQRAP